MKKERKLTSAEERRAARFAEVCERMEQDGYIREDLIAGILQANIWAIVLMLPFAAISQSLFSFVHPEAFMSHSLTEAFLLPVLLIAGLIVHELIHGLTWGVFVKERFRAIEFGFIWKALAPYCTCSAPLTKGQYILGSAMPTLVLGFGLSVFAICIGSFLLQCTAVIMLFSGGADALIILKLLRYQTSSKTVVFFDHPYECGLVAFWKAAPTT